MADASGRQARSNSDALEELPYKVHDTLQAGMLLGKDQSRALHRACAAAAAGTRLPRLVPALCTLAVLSAREACTHGGGASIARVYASSGRYSSQVLAGVC